MNGFDVVILAVLVICTGYGLWKGVVRMAIGIGGLAVSLALALRFSGQGPRWFDGVFSSDVLAQGVAFVAILVGGLILTSVLAWLATRLVQAAEVSWIDRLAGGGVALFGALLLFSGLMVGVTAFVPGAASWSDGSRLMPMLMQVSDRAANLLPDDVEDLYRMRRRLLDERTLPMFDESEAESRKGRSSS